MIGIVVDISMPWTSVKSACMTFVFIFIVSPVDPFLTHVLCSLQG